MTINSDSYGIFIFFFFISFSKLRDQEHFLNGLPHMVC
jgi:hypothetical protein